MAPSLRSKLDYAFSYVIYFKPFCSQRSACSASSMASSKSSIVFDDIFEIENVDPEGKKFDRGMLL
jgi:hypothetical protein